MLNPEEYARNEIINNSAYGIKAYGQSTVFAGEEDIVGGNSIFGNGSYDAGATVNSIIWAINNYWGTSRPSQNQFYSDEGSSIYYQPFLSNPPEGLIINTAQQSPGYISSVSKNSLDSKPENSFPKGGNLSWRIRLLTFLRTHNHSRLIALGDSLLKTALTNTDIRFVLSAMQHSSVFQCDSTFIPYLQTFMQNGSTGPLKRLAGAFLLQNYLKHYRLAAARVWIQAIQSQFPDTELEVFALLKAFHIKLFYENDLEGAWQAFQNLNNKYPEHDYTRLAKIQLESAPGIGGGLQRHLPKTSARQKEKTSFPISFSLAQNYSNPFNPATIIIYDLPGEARVSLIIYNILSQKVKTLVENIQEGGNYRIQWNGKDDSGQAVSSGIYIYRIHAKSLNGEASYNKSLKMILMR